MAVPLQSLINPQSEDQRMVIVIGPYNTGKSAFITSLSTQAVIEVDISSYMPGMDLLPQKLGSFNFGDDKRLFLIEWLGALRLDLFEAALGSFIIGIILIFDSSQPMIFRETKSIWESLKFRDNPPYIIAANSFDVSAAWSIDDLRTALRLPPEEIVVACNAPQSSSTAAVLSCLIASLPASDFISLLAAKLRDLSAP